jgi:RNA polymerase sigma factor (sigma-70 family)
MKNQSPVTQAAFDSLLAWLDPDRERAGAKCEQIRLRLIKLFACRGCPDVDADELADETIARVTVKAPEVSKGWSGDPRLYFYGVAKKVFLEWLRRPKTPPAHGWPPTADPSESEETERRHDCLERCLEKLAPASRALVLDYYRNDRRAKIDHRKELAARLGIAQNALRIRIHRVRTALQECVGACLGRKFTA